MQSMRQLGSLAIRNLIRKQKINYLLPVTSVAELDHVRKDFLQFFHCSSCGKNEEIALPLRRMKPKSKRDTLQYFVDVKQVRVAAGKGGDGAMSFLQLWKNDHAGPDGGDGGHGGHVIFQASRDVTSLNHLKPLIQAQNGERGYNENCCGKNAPHTVTQVPIGTVVRSTNGDILADLEKENMMFIAARGGSGGHGNTFFKSDVNQSPKVAEYGAEGETKQYFLEVKSMAHIGLIGLPNVGKSTLLRAITRARPKVASYPFTTLKPHLGMVLYDDYEQIAVADLPGLIEDSHKNKGLGIMFLKHAERCAALLFMLDVSADEPWKHLETLRNELNQFSSKLGNRPMLVIANKMDLPNAQENLEQLKQRVNYPIIPISAKMGMNLSTLLREIRILYDKEITHKNELRENESVVE